ncbi:hypothetical protein TRFO_35470 [Tritrichomonas foetus]|uniref:Uncharacterized protein n=1 Tax=Tritrichomonas foetus TaxID=1144522 RepID=A0A1J4JII2_9EUKA|nr:hypothetical protein TRFO_35470 [Tritrichomonas foetus]|eukprot:OHS98143.1 hypothetical protein TRFO_35470 [Tritrichomonas foetus]
MLASFPPFLLPNSIDIHHYMNGYFDKSSENIEQMTKSSQDFNYSREEQTDTVLVSEIENFLYNSNQYTDSLVNLFHSHEINNPYLLTLKLSQNGFYQKVIEMIMNNRILLQSLTLFCYSIHLEKTIFIHLIPQSIIKHLFELLLSNSEYTDLILISIGILAECSIQYDVTSPRTFPFTRDIVNHGFHQLVEIARTNTTFSCKATINIAKLIKYQSLNEKQLEIVLNLINEKIVSCTEFGFFEIHRLLEAYLKYIQKQSNMEEETMHLSILTNESASTICKLLISENVETKRWPGYAITSLCEFSSFEAEKLYNSNLLDCFALTGKNEIDNILLTAMMQFILSVENALNRFCGHQIFSLIICLFEAGTFSECSRAALIISALMSRCENEGDMNKLISCFNCDFVDIFENVISCNDGVTLKIMMINFVKATEKAINIQDPELIQHLLSSNFMDTIQNIVDHPREDISINVEKLLCILDDFL